jgi:hypothetical protein
MIRIIIEGLILLATTSYVIYSLWWILFSKEGIVKLWKNSDSE